MATRSSILVWEIQWAEGPGGLQSVGLQKDTTERQAQGLKYMAVLLRTPVTIKDLCHTYQVPRPPGTQQ